MSDYDIIQNIASSGDANDFSDDSIDSYEGSSYSAALRSADSNYLNQLWRICQDRRFITTPFSPAYVSDKGIVPAAPSRRIEIQASPWLDKLDTASDEAHPNSGTHTIRGLQGHEIQRIAGLPLSWVMPQPTRTTITRYEAAERLYPGFQSIRFDVPAVEDFASSSTPLSRPGPSPEHDVYDGAFHPEHGHLPQPDKFNDGFDDRPVEDWMIAFDEGDIHAGISLKAIADSEADTPVKTGVDETLEELADVWLAHAEFTRNRMTRLIREGNVPAARHLANTTPHIEPREMHVPGLRDADDQGWRYVIHTALSDVVTCNRCHGDGEVRAFGRKAQPCRKCHTHGVIPVYETRPMPYHPDHGVQVTLNPEHRIRKEITVAWDGSSRFEAIARVTNSALNRAHVRATLDTSLTPARKNNPFWRTNVYIQPARRYRLTVTGEATAAHVRILGADSAYRNAA